MVEFGIVLQQWSEHCLTRPPPCRCPPCPFPSSGTAAVGAAASLAIAILTDLVFGSSGAHVFAAKVAICSSVGMCIHYAQAIATQASAGSWRASGTAPPSSGGTRTMAAATGGGVSVSVAFTAGLSALYCAGLFSNSFIEAEDGLHRFLGASSLVSLAVLFLLVPASPPPPAAAATDYDDKSSWTARSVVRTTGSNSSGFASPRCDDGLGLLLGLSPKSTAALYAALAAACLRAAAAVQDSAAEGGVSTEAAFGFSRSLLPLPALWYLCRLARGGGSGGSGRTLWGSGAVDMASPRGIPAAASLSGGVMGAVSGWARRRCSHGAVQALSLAAIGAYWVNEVMVAAAEAGKQHAIAAASGSSQGAGAALFGSLLPPMRLLLPRATYLLCLAGLAVTLLRPHGRRRKKQDPVPHKGEEGRPCTPPGWNGSSSPSYAQALAGTAATVVSHLLPVVVLLLGPGSPAVVAFVSVACGCVLRSVSVTAVGGTTCGGGSGAVLPLGAVAVSWSVVGRAFFFLTGHHNQFSRLQYSAAFVGE